MAIPIVGWALSPSLWGAEEQVVFATRGQVRGIWLTFWGVYGGEWFCIDRVLMQVGWPFHMREWSSDVATLVEVAQDQGVHEQCVLKVFWTHVQGNAKPLWWHNTLALIKVDLIQKMGHNNMVQNRLSEWEEFQAISTKQILVANVCWWILANFREGTFNTRVLPWWWGLGLKAWTSLGDD